MMKRICQYCGNEYKTYPSIKPKYCSMKCAGQAKKKGNYIKCAQCGKEVWKYPSDKSKRFCSISCAITARNLTDANPSYHRDISGKNNPMYGRGKNGKDNPMYGMRKEKSHQWKGGHTRKDGYIIAIAPDDHPYPAYIKPSGTKYILLHRLVMEKHLGRYLEPDEVIHHIDGDPSNNEIKNLQLFSNQAEHVKNCH